MDQQPIKLFIATDGELLMIAIMQIVSNCGYIEVAGASIESEGFIDRVISAQPDIVLLKKALLGPDYIRLLKQLKKQSKIKVILVLSDVSEFVEACATNSEGYILPELSSYLLPIGIRMVHEGGIWLGPRIARHVVQNVRNLLQPTSAEAAPSIDLPSTLTAKEKEVMSLLVLEMTNQAIADELGLSIETIRVHVRHILKKLEVRDRIAAVKKISGQFQRIES